MTDLNDPFGRVGRRNQRAYQQFVEHLRQKGINDRRGVATFAARVRRTALKLAALSLVLGGIAALAMPGSATAVFVLVAVAILWLAANLLRTRLFLRSYRELLAAADVDGTSHQAPSSDV